MTLFMMSEVARRLGEAHLALGYLEAATREIASRFDVMWMDRCELAARVLLGDDEYRTSRIAHIVESNRARLRGLTEVSSAPMLRALPAEERAWLTKKAVPRTLAVGEYLVREGDPSRSVFVIQSGVIAVILSGARGESRLIRCLYPGLLLGESSVLAPNPKCTASLRAEQLSHVWEIDAADVKLVMQRCTAFGERLQGTRYIHQIDSFFSLHETIGNLDTEARDNILSCVQTVQTIEDDVIAIAKGEVPEFACLVARGDLALYATDSPDLNEKPARIVGVDQFFGFRDALHQIASDQTAVARSKAVIVFFDAERLRRVAAESSDEVTLTLERLG